MVDAVGTTRYIYTAGNQLQREIAPFGFNTLLLTYTNRLRNVLRLQQPQVFWTNAYYYDAAARLTNITSQAGSFTYTVGAASPGSRLVQKLLLPNTSYITNTFDNVARLTGTYLDNSANSVLDSAVYGYNRANQRTAFTNAAGTYVLYSYDNIGQLQVASSSGSGETRGYSYDAAWNLAYITNGEIVPGFSVDNKNQLTSDPSSYDSYDSNGNLTTRSLLNYTYTYDYENRLIGFTNGTTYAADFNYDGLGRLRKRNDHGYVSSAWISTNTVEYIYDGTRVIQERDINNNPTVSYTRGPDLSGTMEGAGGIGGLLARSSGYSLGNWSTHYFYHGDGNGNITYLVDSSQAQAASYRYDAFGNTLSSSGTMATANLYRFSSKEIHANTGMYIYLYRLYDPSLQRWLNRDPLNEAGFINAITHHARSASRLPTCETANLYRFVGNNPTRYWDLLGLYIGFDPSCSASFINHWRQALEILGSTPSGNKLLAAAAGPNISVTIEMGEDGPQADNTTDPAYPIITLDENDVLGIGPDFPLYEIPPEEMLPPTDPGAAVILAHELGHALGALDEGSGGSNVNDNENPVRHELGLPTRPSYHGWPLIP